MRVYVAHRMSGPEASYLANCAVMNIATRALYEDGYEPYNPAADMVVGLSGFSPLPVASYKRVGFAFLEVCDTMLAIGEASQGVLDEAYFAEALHIPVLWVPDYSQYPSLYAVTLSRYEKEMEGVRLGTRHPFIDATGDAKPPWPIRA